MTREDFIKTHLGGQEPMCGMGLITAASYDAMYNGPHREMIQRHYEYAFELALDAYDIGIKTILATMELAEKYEQGEFMIKKLYPVVGE